MPAARLSAAELNMYRVFSWSPALPPQAGPAAMVDFESIPASVRIDMRPEAVAETINPRTLALLDATESEAAAAEAAAAGGRGVGLGQGWGRGRRGGSGEFGGAKGKKAGERLSEGGVGTGQSAFCLPGA